MFVNNSFYSPNYTICQIIDISVCIYNNIQVNFTNILPVQFLVKAAVIPKLNFISRVIYRDTSTMQNIGAITKC